MNNVQRLFTITLFATLLLGESQAQLPGASAVILPASPTSADNLKLVMVRNCFINRPHDVNLYRVSMAQNVITVTLGPTLPADAIFPSACPPNETIPREEVDLGRLPAGEYVLNAFEPATTSLPARAVVSNSRFTVTDARQIKAAPWVRLDYSGHWWDPTDSGWGLFIWHDARDNVLAAWFTYTADGKPAWYVFQPKWQTDSVTFDADLIQTSRLPGLTSPPPNPTTLATVGTASLNFQNYGTADEGTLSYKFTNGTTQSRRIQRFKP